MILSISGRWFPKLFPQISLDNQQAPSQTNSRRRVATDFEEEDIEQGLAVIVETIRFEIGTFV